MAKLSPEEKAARAAARAEKKNVKPAAAKADRQDAGGLVEVEVQRGRRLDHDGQTYLPKTKLWVTKEERARLLKLGTIVNPDGNVPAFGNGPDFGRENEPKVIGIR